MGLLQDGSSQDPIPCPVHTPRGMPTDPAGATGFQLHKKLQCTGSSFQSCWPESFCFGSLVLSRVYYVPHYRSPAVHPHLLSHSCPRARQHGIFLVGLEARVTKPPVVSTDTSSLCLKRQRKVQVCEGNNCSPLQHHFPCHVRAASPNTTRQEGHWLPAGHCPASCSHWGEGAVFTPITAVRFLRHYLPAAPGTGSDS